MKKLKTFLLGLLLVGSFAPLCADSAENSEVFDQLSMGADVLIGSDIAPEVMLQWGSEERNAMREVLIMKRDSFNKESISADRALWLTRAQKIAGGASIVTGFATAMFFAMAARYANTAVMATMFSELSSSEFSQECSSIATKAHALTWKWFGGTALSCAAFIGSAVYAGKVTQELENSQVVGFVKQRIDDLVEFIDKANS